MPAVPAPLASPHSTTTTTTTSSLSSSSPRNCGAGLPRANLPCTASAASAWTATLVAAMASDRGSPSSASALLSSAITAVDALSSALLIAGSDDRGALPSGCSCAPECRCPPPCPCPKAETRAVEVKANLAGASVNAMGCSCAPECRCPPPCPCPKAETKAVEVKANLAGASVNAMGCSCAPECRCPPPCPCPKAEIRAVEVKANLAGASTNAMGCSCAPECRCPPPCPCAKTAVVSEEQVQEFGRALLAAAVVLEAAPLEGSDKLYLCQIDCGEEKPRQVVTGLQKFVQLDTLIGARVMVILNLKPAKLAGVESAAMILCGSSADHSTVVLSQVPESGKPGDRVFISGHSSPSEYDKKLSSKVWPKIQEHLKVGPNGEACYRGRQLVTSSGPVLISGVAPGSAIS